MMHLLRLLLALTLFPLLALHTAHAGVRGPTQVNLQTGGVPNTFGTGYTITGLPSGGAMTTISGGAPSVSIPSSGKFTDFSGFVYDDLGNPRVLTGGSLPTKAGNVAIDVAAKVVPSALGTAVVKLAQFMPYVSLAMAVAQAIRDVGFGTQDNGNGGTAFTKKGLTDGYSYCLNNAWGGFVGCSPTMEAVCNSVTGPLGNWGYITTTSLTNKGADGVANCVVNGNYNNGYPGQWIYPGFRKLSQQMGDVPATPQEVADAIAAKSGWPSSSTIAEAAKMAIQQGGPLPVETPTVTGPASVSAPEVTTARDYKAADGTPMHETTTSRDYTEATYQGDTVTTTDYNTSTTSTTNQTTNITTNVTTITNYNTGNVTTTTTTGPAPSVPVTATPTTPSSTTTTSTTPTDTATDTPLPGIPKLYDPKYPQGLEGVWNTQKDALKGTALLGLLSKLMPNVQDGGTCPTMMLPLDVGIRNFGSFDVAPPCWLWAFGKAVIIASALLLARRLIFGA